VIDDGPGIPDDMRGRLFRPFATGHRDTGGRGLGLFVVRQAIRKLGGSIRVETSSSGTTFRLEFPSAKPLEGS
jgi:signal transduction histidine kinase